MHHSSVEIPYKSFKDAADLSEKDQFLVQETRKLTNAAYAPYSGFKVASLAQLDNGTLVHGTNQENASYPIGLCAERVMLAAISSVAPQMAVNTVCISYQSESQPSNQPIAPCGICRQSLVEFESRFTGKIRLLLTGQTVKYLNSNRYQICYQWLSKRTI